jgi:type I restriction enzyme, S subunit
VDVKPGYKQTEVGVIPEDWQVVALGEIANVKTGPFGSSLHERDYVDDGTPIITVEHLGEQGVTHRNLPMVSDHDKRRLSSYLLETDDIVFSRVGSVDRNSLISDKERGWLFSGRLLRIRCESEKVVSPYLSFHFQHEPTKQRIRSVAVGQTMASLNTAILKNIKVMLPPAPEEQTAIAEALSDADTLIEALEKLIAKKRAIKQGAMQELLTGKKRLPGFQQRPGYRQTEAGVIPEDWTTGTLQPYVRHHNAGVYKKQELYGQGCNIIGVSDIYDVDHVDGQEFARVPISEQERTKYILVPNDLLYGESSLVREGIARTVYVTERGAGTGFAWHTRRYSIDQNVLYSPYLYYWLQARPARKHMMNQCIQTAITGINTYAYFACPVLILPLAEQTAIASVLSDMDAEIEALENKLSKYRQIKQGMMQELLTGNIRLI